ncbi:MAG: hypothetical protein WCK25_00860 [Actinomycetes bacterium]
MSKATVRTGLLTLSGLSFLVGLFFQHYVLFVVTMASLWIASWIRPN